MHNTSSKLVLLGLLGLLAVISGCVSETPLYDAKFGDAVNAAKAQQTIHPDAPNKVHKPSGLDGRAAKNVMDNYHKDSEKPKAPPNIFTIGVGSGGGGASN